MEDYPSVKLQGLDKSVGRTRTFEATVGSTIQYGPLFIKIHACRKAPPIEKPESAAFLQIWEVPPGEEKSEWAFSGWMFASSPSLSAMDHAVYDVWVLDCVGREEPLDDEGTTTVDETGDQTDQTDPAVPPVEEESPVTESIEDVPVDMEAEPEEAEPAIETPANDLPLMDQPYSPPPVTPQDQTQAPAVLPADPASEQGVTAYDFMQQQQGTNAAPAPQPVQRQQPIIETPAF